MPKVDEMTGNGRKTVPISEAEMSEENMEEKMETRLVDLPDDVLYHVLSFLDVTSLCTICRVSRYYRFLASKDCVWIPHLNRQTVHIKNKTDNIHIQGNHSQFQRRDCVLSRKNKYKSSVNYEFGRFKEKNLISFQVKLIPWLQRDDQSNLWLSTKHVIKCFRIQRNGSLQEWKGRQLTGLKDDVSKFVIKNDITVSGCRDGSICGWNNKSNDLLFNYKLHESESHCVDFYNNTVVSGSRDKTVKVVSMYKEHADDNLLKKTIFMGDRVWSLKLAPDGSVLATGTAGNKGLPALTTWDLNVGEMLSTLDPDHRKGAGIIDMKFEDNNTLLTCGYDTRLRMWDLRTDSCVASWTEPFDSAVFCFETDNNVTMVTGTARYGMSRLWDKRKRDSIQQYYTGRSRSSPVYSLTFDPERLYIALDLGLNKLDFT